MIQPGEVRLRKDLSFLKAGLYLIKLEGTKKTDILRIVKQ